MAILPFYYFLFLFLLTTFLIHLILTRTFLSSFTLMLPLFTFLLSFPFKPYHTFSLHYSVYFFILLSLLIFFLSFLSQFSHSPFFLHFSTLLSQNFFHFPTRVLYHPLSLGFQFFSLNFLYPLLHATFSIYFQAPHSQSTFSLNFLNSLFCNTFSIYLISFWLYFVTS